MLRRYSFELPESVTLGELRSLRDPSEPAEEDILVAQTSFSFQCYSAPKTQVPQAVRHVTWCVLEAQHLQCVGAEVGQRRQVCRGRISDREPYLVPGWHDHVATRAAQLPPAARPHTG